MSDIKIVSQATLRETIADWFLTPDGELDESDELANVVKVALMSDRRSNETEIRPDPDSEDRRGWWGDLDAQEIWNGWPIGCKNWLLTRAKISDFYSWEGDTVVRAEDYTREALQPLIDRKLATRIDVSAVRTDIQEIVTRVTVYRGPLQAIELEFQGLWDGVLT